MLPLLGRLFAGLLKILWWVVVHPKAAADVVRGLRTLAEEVSKLLSWLRWRRADARERRERQSREHHLERLYLERRRERQYWEHHHLERLYLDQDWYHAGYVMYPRFRRPEPPPAPFGGWQRPASEAAAGVQPEASDV